MMKLDWDTWRRPGAWGLGGALMVAGMSLVSSTALAQQPSDGQGSLALFSVMMPAFTSPRCVNCHGGMDVASGDGHGGGAVAFPRDDNGDMQQNANKECIGCHTLATQVEMIPAGHDIDGNPVPAHEATWSPWRLAGQRLSFAIKDATALCLEIVTEARLYNHDPETNDAFLRDLIQDPLIDAAFDGRGGIGDDSPAAPVAPEPPPMSRDEFAAAAARWISVGHAGCGGGWNGKITLTLTAHSAQPGFDSMTQWQAVVNVVSGQATASIQYTAHENQDTPPGPGNSCATFRHIRGTGEV